ncbi:MAG: HD-GYP domain-containing protein [Thiohalospira sp.]
MLRTVTVSQLEPGMFIHDLQMSWLQHPFLRSQFLLRSQDDIDRIRALGIREVVIDTGRAERLPEGPEERQEETARLQAELDAYPGERPRADVLRQRRVEVDEELETARPVREEATGVVESVMHDARLGRQVDLARVEPVAERMMESIFRNPNALLSLGQVRRVDRYTFEHSIAVGVLLVTYARARELDPEVIYQLGLGGLLHDIGKARVPEAILTKPGALSAEEYQVMQRHVNLGLEMVGDMPELPPPTLEVIAQHHERWDGSGYPNGLCEDEIGPYGQMAAVVDVYDAITSDRCYHRGEHPTLVLRRMLEWSRSHFREEVVHHFIQCVGIYPAGTLVRMESGRLAVVLDPGEKILYPTVKVFFNTHTHSLVQPEVIDLANPGYHDDHIAAYEDPRRWDFDLNRLLG